MSRHSAVSTELGACGGLRRDVGGESRAGSLQASGQGAWHHLHAEYVHKSGLMYGLKKKKNNQRKPGALTGPWVTQMLMNEQTFSQMVRK